MNWMKVTVSSIVFALTCTSVAKAEPTKNFAGINFGVGISLTLDNGEHDRVVSASVVDGVVRVDEDSNSVARVILESHYFFTPGKSFVGLVASRKWGIGPFIALQPGTDEIIEAVGGGIMVGFQRSEDSAGSWNFGIGFIVDPSVRVLGDGVKENEPLPGNETEVRYKNTSQGGVLFVTSFAF